MSQLFLWADAVSPVRRRKKRPPRLCSSCKKKLPKKPRSVMPIGHALQTVMGIMIDRLDGMTDDIARIVWDELGERFDCDRKAAANVAGRLIDALNYKFFPEMYEDGEPYTPDPAGRMDVPPKAGLVPNVPTVAILACHWLKLGQSSPVSKMTATVKDKLGNEATVPLFSPAELARLGERMEKRQAGQRTN